MMINCSLYQRSKCFTFGNNSYSHQIYLIWVLYTSFICIVLWHYYIHTLYIYTYIYIHIASKNKNTKKRGKSLKAVPFAMTYHKYS